MDFGLSEEQELLQETVRNFASNECPSLRLHEIFDGETGHDAELWRGMMELGLGGLALPEAYGGAGLEVLDLALVAEVLGETALPGPFLGHALAGLAISLAGSERQKERWLPRLAAGDALGSVALGEEGDAWDPERWAASADGGKLTGTKTHVPYGALADVIAVGVEGGRLALVERGAAGLKVDPTDGVDRSRRLDRVTLESVAADELPGAAGGRLRDAGLVLLAADAFGGAWRLVRESVEYAKTREQFGQAIAQFQAIKHKLADMYIKNELARANVYYGAWALESSEKELPVAAAAARVAATEAYHYAAKENIQTHGGIGFTWEADCHLYYRRSKLLALALGSLHSWKDRLISTLVEQERASTEVAGAAG